MALQEKQLGQVRENSTNAVTVYSPGTISTTAIIKSIVVCNQSGISATFRIFLDDNGTTYDKSTALYYDIVIEADTTIQIDTYWTMNDSTGNLAYRSSSANALTITTHGYPNSKKCCW